MIIIDTNVVSEAVRANRSPAVMSWLSGQDGTILYLTSVSLSELLVGIAILPDGGRKRGLTEVMEALTGRLFAGRLLAFDEAAARQYALLMSRARATGRTIHVSDGQIAAIAAVHGFAVATRDVTPFLAAGLRVINPWTA